jgi:hypothetical protein
LHPYRAPPPRKRRERGPIRLGLDRIAFRRKVFLAAVLSAPLAILLSASVNVLVGKRVHDILWTLLGPALLVAILSTGAWMSLARCPRCKRYFSRSLLRTDPFNTRCLHCVLSTRDDDAA